MWRARSQWLPVLLAVSFLALPALGAPEDFPRSPALEPKIAFWKRIYSQIDSDHGLLHDSRDLRVVYAIVGLPEGLGRRARDRLLQKERAPYKRILARLGQGKRTGLSVEEQRVLAMFPADVSNATLRAAAGRIRFQLGQADRFREGVVRMGRWEWYIRQVLAERSRRLEGELLGLEERRVRLRLEDGAEVSVPLTEITGAHLVFRWE